MCGKVELNNVQSSLLFILRFLIQLLGGIVIGMLIGNFQKVIKRGKTQSEKKQYFLTITNILHDFYCFWAFVWPGNWIGQFIRA